MKQVKLRALEPEDIEVIYLWENDASVWDSSEAHVPYSRHNLTQYILTASTGDIYADRQLRLIGESEGKAVGCVDLYDFDPYHHRAGIGLLVDSAVRRQGYATAIVAAMLDFCKRELQLHLLYCDVAESNVSSLSVMQGSGFSIVGRRRDWLWMHDHYESALALEKIL